MCDNTNEKNKIKEYIFIYIYLITDGVHITLDPTLLTLRARIQKIKVSTILDYINTDFWVGD